MMGSHALLLDDAPADSLSDVLHEEFTAPGLGCSDLDAATFCAMEPQLPSLKRAGSDSDEEEEQQLQQLQSEAGRLRRVNHLLKASFTCVQEKKDNALGDEKKLLGLVRALQPHKHAFLLHPLASQRSSVGSNKAEIGADADLAEAFLAIPPSPSRSQPGPAAPAMTPCKTARRVQSAAPPSRGSLGRRLPERLDQDPDTAHAAAVAAAALAVNGGNPAAALLDLLNLAMTRRMSPTTV